MGYRNYGPAKGLYVSKDGNGDFTTIQAGITAAAAESGINVIIGAGTYTENPIMTSGINVFGLSNVTVIGQFTLASGAATIINCTCQTNSATIATLSAGTLTFNDCFLNATNNTAFSLTGSGSIVLNYCNGNISTTGITLCTSSSTGGLDLNYTNIQNSGGSTTASTFSAAGGIFMDFSYLGLPVSVTSTGTCNGAYSTIYCENLNATALTTAGTATSGGYFCTYTAGSASALSIGSGTTVNLISARISSTNTDAITGGGTLNYQNLFFSSTSDTINVTTQTGGAAQGGRFQAPSAGYLGEQIRGVLVSGSAATLSNNTAANIITLSLTAGIWDVCCLGVMNGGVTGTSYAISISLNSDTQGTDGDANCGTPTSPTAIESVYLTVAGYRVTLATTTNVYMVGSALFTAGTLKCYGRISATRVG